jgi:hypothetical protein
MPRRHERRVPSSERACYNNGLEQRRFLALSWATNMLGAQIAPWSCGNSPRVDPGTLPISMPANAEAKQICREEEADGQAAENFRSARRKCARDIRPSDRLSSREEFRGKGARQAVHASDSRARWAPGNRDAGAVPEEESAEDLHVRLLALASARLGRSERGPRAR